MVLDRSGNVLYMSRSMIPVAKNGKIDQKILKKNVGFTVFRHTFLDKLNSLRDVETVLDVFEGLEQLRWLELGFKLKAVKVKHYGFGIDIPDQIPILEKRISCLHQPKK